MNPPTIPEYFAGKKIFMTGGTGFLGKVLVEKLLRSCPDLDTIYILIRPKKGQTAKERWQEIAKQEVFSVLKKVYPDNLNKIVVIEGDTSTKDLGISEENRKLLTDNVNVIFNVAATVLFFENIAESLKMNVRGTYDMAELAKDMKKLECFLHVSTAYSNIDKPFTANEEVYPTYHNWKDLLQVLDITDSYTLGCITDKLLAGHPNSYTLTKALAEQIMLQYSQSYPICIMRPSVVLNSVREPMPGWVDNLNGPAVVGVLTGTGLMRVQRGTLSNRLEYTSVDIAANSFISAVWDMGHKQDKAALDVYNCSFGESLTTTGDRYRDYGLEYARDDPFERIVWHPYLISTSCPFLYHLLFILLQVLPAAVLDGLSWAVGEKPRLWKITKKIAMAHKAFTFFTMRDFLFPTVRYNALKKRLHPSDAQTFVMDLPEGFTERDCVRLCGMGIKKFVLNETKPLEQRVKVYKRMEMLDRLFRFGLLALIAWYLYCKVQKYIY